MKTSRIQWNLSKFQFYALLPKVSGLFSRKTHRPDVGLVDFLECEAFFIGDSK